MEEQNQNNKNSAATDNAAEPEVVGNNNAELDVCKKQAEEYLNNWKRERADFVNYKKDEVKRMGEFIKFANEGLIVEVIEIVDDLYIASKQSKNEGLGQIIKKFEELLKKYGVEKIEVVDEKFDPLKHDAVESEEGGEKLQEIRTGYMMQGRVIRPARVKIIK